MALITKPDMEFIWASGGAVVKPSDVKIQTGWTPEVPPHQWENWIQKRQDEYLAHINQRGIPEWDGNTEYEAAGLSYVQGNNGVVYKSVAASGPSTTVQDPTTDVSDTYWTVAFASTTQASETAQGIVELATTAEAEAGLDDERAMTPLKVKQAIEQFAGDDLLNAPIATIASAGTVDLTAGAPNTSQVTITGNAAITAVTIAANRCVFVKFTGSPTLTNNASIVTETGANIVIVPGESVMFRATAANTVEVIQSRQNVRAAMNVTGDAPMFACRSWVNFDGVPATPTIRGSGNVSSVTKTGTGQYTVNFITAMPDANYAVMSKGFGAGSDFAGATATAAGSFTCQSRSPANVGVNIDALLNMYGVFR